MLAEAKGIAAELTEQRRKAAKQLEGEIVRELSELDMDKVKMRVAVRTGTKLSAHGCDTVTFEISVNPGEPEKPLSKVASGGELSRIMLALKNVLTAGEDVGMLILTRSTPAFPAMRLSRSAASCLPLRKEADAVRYPSAADCRHGRSSPAHFQIRAGRPQLHRCQPDGQSTPRRRNCTSALRRGNLGCSTPQRRGTARRSRTGSVNPW